jgi:hypothetical protein
VCAAPGSTSPSAAKSGSVCGRHLVAATTLAKKKSAAQEETAAAFDESQRTLTAAELARAELYVPSSNRRRRLATRRSGTATGPRRPTSEASARRTRLGGE